MKSPAPVVNPPEWTWKTFPRRYLLVIVAFFGFLHVYVLRVNMSIAIVAMTSNQTQWHSNGTVQYVRKKLSSARLPAESEAHHRRPLDARL